ncbi:MFS transporter [Candidatus Formimonas warabiya]|uniref:Major facilitator superfamily (MFS) profile domain-containing protein n=1 Tax=Formimonas warabiya TaxID=1761012 RepID=A0A3G1KY65_FORW1|nr:MFS transporter [Candidatus Formimonas warabiya]ATW27155.1 hypothetical protein DCMF_22550 [Candidatus Formimonas warabiya]
MERWKKNLVILVLAQFVMMASFTMMLPYFALFIGELGVKDPKQVAFWAGTIVSANFLGQALLSPFWGSLADRYGRKAMVLRSAVACGIFTIMSSFVQTPFQLLGVRLLLGSFSGYNAASIAFISTETPKERIGYALGWLQTGQQAANLIGPALGGVMVSFWGFREGFVITGIMNLFVLAAVSLGTKETFKPAPEKRVPQERENTWGVLKWLSTQPLLVSLFLVIIITQLASKSIEPQMAIYISPIYHGDNTRLIIAYVFIATAISNVILGPILGKLGDRHNSFKILFWCLFGAGLVSIGQIWVGNMWQLYVVRFAFGGFLAGILPSANALISIHTPMEHRGSIFGFMASASAFGMFTGPIFGGSIIGLFGVNNGFLAVFALTGIMFIMGSVFINQWGKGREGSEMFMK